MKKSELKQLIKTTILSEIKVNSPDTIPKISFETFKKALIKDMDERFHELLDGEETEDFIQNSIDEFANQINQISYTDGWTIKKFQKIYNDVGFGNEQLLLVMFKIFVRQ